MWPNRREPVHLRNMLGSGAVASILVKKLETWSSFLIFEGALALCFGGALWYLQRRFRK